MLILIDIFNSLLPDRFNTLQGKVLIIEHFSYESVMLSDISSELKNDLMNDSSILGNFNSDSCRIDLFIFNMQDKDPVMQVLLQLSTYLHELQHAYQYLKIPFMYNKRGDYSHSDKDRYENSLIEINANEFVSKFMMRNKGKINKLFNISQDWLVSIDGCIHVSDKESVKMRPDWDNYFMDITKLVAERSTCTRRKVGAVIVKDNRILTTGYNGVPSGLKHCADRGCLRDDMKIPSGERQELCMGVHAEQNAIIQAAKYGISLEGSTIYVTNQPCVTCIKMIINVGIVRVVYLNSYNDELSKHLWLEAGIKVESFGK